MIISCPPVRTSVRTVSFPINPPRHHWRTRAIRAPVLRTKALAIKSHDKPICNVRKNLALGAIFFSNLFVYTITRDMKDVMFVIDCGAEYIPFVKTWINLPFSLIVVGVYQKLLQRLDFHTCYRIMYVSMMLITSFIGIGMYPIREALAIPNSHTLLANWVVTLYYVVSPIYGPMIISVLFWSLANMYTKVQEAKRIYPLMGFVANSALIVAGISARASCAYWGTNNWNANVITLCVANLFMSSCSLILHRYIERNFDMNNIADKNKTPKELQKTTRIRDLLKEPFVINMIIMSASYGLLVSLFENIW